MPTKTKRDEEKWNKAKEIAKKQGRPEDYAYIMGIYKNMKPDYEFKSKEAALVERVAHRFIAAQSGLASGGKISKTKLEAWCKQKGWPLPEYEAYGRKVCAYWHKNPPGMSRQEMEAELVSVGAKVNPKWNSGQPGTEVCNISYFKAWHWDE